MKKIMTISIIFVLLLAMTSCTNAQQAAKGFNENGSTAYRPPITLYQVNIRAMRDFMQSFKNATEITWFQASDGFVVYFINSGIRSQSRYNKGGICVYNLRTYSESNLSRDIRGRVKSIYYDYSIKVINEITTPDAVIYIVQVEDKSCIIELRVVEGEQIVEIKKIYK